MYDIKKNYKLKFNYLNKGLTGLCNLGNTCFMNSILQCLSNTLTLTEYFLKEQYRDEDQDRHHQARKEYVLVLCYSNLIKNIWEQNTLLKPRSFLSIVSKLIPSYKVGTQQDSHEFLTQLLQLIHSGICYQIEVGIKGEITNESDRLMVESINQWKLHFENNYSVIIDSFYGMTSNLISCQHCNHSSRTFEPFSCISLPIPDTPCHLIECLHNYFSVQSTISDYTCEKENCKKLGTCSKETQLWMLPNYIIITFKRFNNKNKKITTKINFLNKEMNNSLSEHFDLDLTPFICPNKQDSNKYIYSLYAVNCHTGDTGGGHYYSYIKNVDGKFYMMNDANVTLASIDDICSDTAYILFYYRKFIT